MIVSSTIENEGTAECCYLELNTDSNKANGLYLVVLTWTYKVLSILKPTSETTSLLLRQSHSYGQQNCLNYHSSGINITVHFHRCFYGELLTMKICQNRWITECISSCTGEKKGHLWKRADYSVSLCVICIYIERTLAKNRKYFFRCLIHHRNNKLRKLLTLVSFCMLGATCLTMLKDFYSQATKEWSLYCSSW